MNIEDIPLGCNAFWLVHLAPQYLIGMHGDTRRGPTQTIARGHVIAKTSNSVVVTYPRDGQMVCEELEAFKITCIEP